ncbi:50S ribosomal protein L3 N(5)-glutamine methyltransferase [Salinisphaera sp. P385]|uniref:50S ribosomal protein L3 N(5)-glutamine methyltransferase n=1 Tax=Spectribacter acetivorans TaxID=3075603 RepID=A0ABU3B496_9GAMM|nr:50S ribosomal protein L3 N(5)-glutamine methyltransferase [Salinisphaera sp. P385]MDT0616935.1 50S ribosomal protein L3 N(5)-glutamine methyltransferase [Salinisphaera sp. P385]
MDPSRLAAHLTTIRDLIRWGGSAFNRAGLAFGHGSDNAMDEARHLVLHSLALPVDVADDYLSAHVTPEEAEVALNLLQRRIDERQPAPYLTGEAWFAGLPFFVDQRVLVPRSPIAEIIEAEFQPWLDDREPLRILDVGTGSGAIAIACAMAFPDAEVVGTDVSEDALAVARRNAERHGVSPRMRWRIADLYDGLDDEAPFDLIVTNPPYVSGEEMDTLDPEYRHEPTIAFSGGGDGLDLVERLIFATPPHLAPGGLFVLEVGHTCFALEQRWPEMPIEWVELERGGLGVGVLEADDLDAWVAHCHECAASATGE